MSPVAMKTFILRRFNAFLTTVTSKAVKNHARNFSISKQNDKNKAPEQIIDHSIRFPTNIKRSADRYRLSRNVDNDSWSVTAYNLCDELKIEDASKLLDKLVGYRLDPLPVDIQGEAVVLRSRSADSIGDDLRKKNREHSLNDIFLFREGSVVFWGVPHEHQRRILHGLSSLKINPNAKELIQEEKEHIHYTLSDSSDKSRLKSEIIQLSTKQDESSMLLDQFAFSHAIALSVKLGIWEMILDNYIDSVRWITENMRAGKSINLSRSQVFKKTGEILCLKHSINLSSDLLDLPDLYWDRNNQEEIFSSVFAYLNVKRRTNVINEKLENCCELMNLLACHMNDRHHIRLEWMIIVLITVEVAFEVVRFYREGIQVSVEEVDSEKLEKQEV